MTKPQSPMITFGAREARVFLDILEHYCSDCWYVIAEDPELKKMTDGLYNKISRIDDWHRKNP